MRNYICLIGLIFFISSCLKDDQTNKLYTIYDDTVKYIINYSDSDSRILDYSKYVNNGFIEKTFFIKNDTIIEKITENSNNEIISRKIFSLGSNGYAASSVDSSISSVFGIQVKKKYYEYQEEFLVKESCFSIVDEVISSTIQSWITQTIQNENIICQNIEKPDDIQFPQIYSSYEYTDIISKLDLTNFSNGITGRMSKNLIKCKFYDNGITSISGDHNVAEISNSFYTYELDNNGFVTKMIERYIPNSDNYFNKISVTIYEYNHH